MRLETSRPEFIRDLLYVVGTLVEEARFTFYPDKVTLVTMDPGHMGLLDLEIPADAFDVYECTETRTLFFNVVKARNTVFRSNAKKLDAMLTIELEEEKGRLLFVYTDDLRREKRIPLLEPPDEEVPEPRIFYKSEVRLVTESIRSVLKDFNGYEHFSIKLSEDQVKFGANDDESAEDIPLKRSSDHILELKYNDNAGTHQIANFSVGYLAPFFNQVCKIAEVVTLSLSTDMPIKVDAEIYRGHLYYYIAPCIGGNYLGAEWVDWSPVPTLYKPLEIVYRCGHCGKTISKSDIVCPYCKGEPLSRTKETVETIDELYNELRDLIHHKYSISIKDKDNIRGSPIVSISPAAGYESHPWTHFRGITAVDALKRAINKLKNPSMDYKDLDGTIWRANEGSIYGEEHTRLFLSSRQIIEPTEPIEPAPEPIPEPEPPAKPTPAVEGYTCEECGAAIPDGREIRLEDGSINCINCAPEDRLNQYQRYIKKLHELELEAVA